MLGALPDTTKIPVNGYKFSSYKPKPRLIFTSKFVQYILSDRLGRPVFFQLAVFADCIVCDAEQKARGIFGFSGFCVAAANLNENVLSQIFGNRGFNTKQEDISPYPFVVFSV